MSSGIGIAEVGESLRVSAMWDWVSSKGSSSLLDVLEPNDRPRERTTSPLHMGQVRRRVVSQGVLQDIYVSTGTLHSTGIGYSHAVSMEFMPTGQTHNPALTVDILLETDNAFDLSACVLFSTRFWCLGARIFYCPVA